MPSSKFGRVSAVALLLFYVGSAFAITPEEDDREKKCKKPKFRFFEPAANSEVLPGSQIGFHVSKDASQDHIKAEAKGIPLKLNIRNRVTHFDVTAALPPELQDTFARISLHARAAEGECMGHDGWLLKVVPSSGAAATAKPADTQPAAAK
jgi:hypothetical protein